jgi:hypothetical protein
VSEPEPVTDVVLQFDPKPGWVRMTLFASGHPRFIGPTSPAAIKEMIAAMEWAARESERMKVEETEA